MVHKIKNIIIVDKNIQNVKKIINEVINKIKNQNIKTFVATDKYEIQKIEQANDTNLILINKDLKNMYKSQNNIPVFYYWR